LYNVGHGGEIRSLLTTTDLWLPIKSLDVFLS
jgi:hypothetical protein